MINSTSKKSRVLVSGATGSVGQSIIKHLRRNFPLYDLYGTYNSSTEIARTMEKEYGVTFIELNAMKTKEPNILPQDISILINSVGVNLSSAKCENTTAELIGDTCEINLRIPLLLIQNYLPFMKDQRWGRIVNVNSIWGIRGSANNLSYNISKHALTALTRTVALEYFQYGITANDVCPGPIESNMMNQIIQQSANEHNLTFEEEYAQFCNSLRMKRMVTPAEIASLVVFLCSEYASGINGVSIPVDCGMTI